MKKALTMIMTGLALAAGAAFMILKLHKRMEGVGIIGGADAPTAIFLMQSTPGKLTMLALGLGLGLMAAGAVTLLRSRKK